MLTYNFVWGVVTNHESIWWLIIKSHCSDEQLCYPSHASQCWRSPYTCASVLLLWLPPYGPDLYPIEEGIQFRQGVLKAVLQNTSIYPLPIVHTAWNWTETGLDWCIHQHSVTVRKQATCMLHVASFGASTHTEYRSHHALRITQRLNGTKICCSWIWCFCVVWQVGYTTCGPGPAIYSSCPSIHAAACPWW